MTSHLDNAIMEVAREGARLSLEVGATAPRDAAIAATAISHHIANVLCALDVARLEAEWDRFPILRLAKAGG